MMTRGVAVFFLLFCLSIDTMFGCFRFHISRSTQNTCIPKICVSYWTRKVAIQEDCCKSIVEMDDDCANYVFYKFHNDFFQALLKNHCSSKASPSPAPPKAN
ncbi:hypothetical protein C1H46_000954 [Malus baccata]|uniref:Prolamin-like domain-containing protein n=1 Tax=Malus baccata TaxID=106549 RepID=A0A540NQS9_MALBA|nr:hypothetical protein C1H46_000954 [Malus baccata]